MVFREHQEERTQNKASHVWLVFFKEQHLERIWLPLRQLYQSLPLGDVRFMGWCRVERISSVRQPKFILDIFITKVLLNVCYFNFSALLFDCLIER